MSLVSLAALPCISCRLKKGETPHPGSQIITIIDESSCSCRELLYRKNPIIATDSWWYLKCKMCTVWQRPTTKRSWTLLLSCTCTTTKAGPMIPSNPHVEQLPCWFNDSCGSWIGSVSYDRSNRFKEIAAVILSHNKKDQVSWDTPQGIGHWVQVTMRRINVSLDMEIINNIWEDLTAARNWMTMQ